MADERRGRAHRHGDSRRAQHDHTPLGMGAMARLTGAGHGRGGPGGHGAEPMREHEAGGHVPMLPDSWRRLIASIILTTSRALEKLAKLLPFAAHRLRPTGRDGRRVRGRAPTR